MKDSKHNCLFSFIDQNQTYLFYSMTSWKQIDFWLKTLRQTTDLPIEKYAFLLRKQKILIDDNQTISLVIDRNESITIDVINENTIIEVVFSYETKSYTIDALKSTKVSSLLHHEELFKELNLINFTLNDCALVLEETNEEILIENYSRKSIGDYCTTETQSVRFRISISIQITKYDDNKQIKLCLPNRQITIEQLLLQITDIPLDVYKYLALNDTQKILDSNEIFSNLNQSKFILVKENETCLVSIQDSNNSERHQRFIVSATIADVYQENQMDVLHQYLRGHP